MNGKRDYYEVLGVNRSAGDDDLRKAYRALAREYHPDLHPGDSGIAENFKDINEAYEVLRDPKKRSAYDRFGHAGVQGRATQATVDFGDLGDLFEQFFGFRAGGRGRQPDAPRRGSDLRAAVELTFAESAFGVTKQVQIKRQETCTTCMGSGAAPGTKPIRCETCQGSGEIRRVQQSIFGSFVNLHTCPDCRGRGERPGAPCPECSGARRVDKRRTLEVDIPAGVENGTQIRLAGEGDEGLMGGPSGDLFVGLSVQSDPLFERHGDDVHIELWINPAQAALGAEVEVPTLDGTARVHVPAGIQTGDEIRLDGQGVPHLRSRGRGAQVVTAFVRTPDKLDRDQREMLTRLAASLPAAHVARREHSIWDKIRGKFS